MRIGIATDHGSFNLKEEMAARLRAAGYEVVDFGAYTLNPGDDYPDFVIPLAQAVSADRVWVAVLSGRRSPGISSRCFSHPSLAPPSAIFAGLRK